MAFAGQSTGTGPKYFINIFKFDFNARHDVEMSTMKFEVGMFKMGTVLLRSVLFGVIEI